MKRILGLLLVMLILVSCEKRDFSEKTRIKTYRIERIGNLRANAYGRVVETKDDILTFGHVWSKEKEPSLNNNKTEYTDIDADREFKSYMYSSYSSPRIYVWTYYTTATSVVFPDSVSFNADVCPASEGKRIYCDNLQSVCKSKDNGYLFCGSNKWHNSLDYIHDISVMKISSDFSDEWSYELKGNGVDIAHSICEDDIGNIFVCGSSSSNDDIVGANNGKSDIVILKLKSNGALSWKKIIGGSQDDIAKSLVVEGSNIYVAATSYSGDGDIANNNGGADMVLVKLSGSGDIEWVKNYGTANNEDLTKITISNGNIVMAGTTEGNGSDMFLVWSDINGGILKQRILSGISNDNVSAMYSQDGDLLLGGAAISASGDFEDLQVPGMCMLKLDSEGDIKWISGNEIYTTYYGAINYIGLSYGNEYLVTTEVGQVGKITAGGKLLWMFNINLPYLPSSPDARRKSSNVRYIEQTGERSYTAVGLPQNKDNYTICNFSLRDLEIER